MLPYKGNLLLPVGPTLRLFNLKTEDILLNKQIGHSQIFQIQENSTQILVVNFEGLLTLLSKEDLSIQYQFNAIGKEIRHVAFTDDYIATSS